LDEIQMVRCQDFLFVDRRKYHQKWVLYKR
jgi:hypothetical protein